MNKQTDKETIKEADKKLNKCILSFFNEGKEFWTILASQLKRVPMDNIKTITVSYTEKGLELNYDPQYVLEADTRVLRYHIVHECVHIIYRHAHRFESYREVVDLASLKSEVKTTKNPKCPVKASDLAMDIICNMEVENNIGGDCVEAGKGVTFSLVPDIPMNGSYYRRDEASTDKVLDEIIKTYTEVVSSGKQQGKKGNGGGGAGKQDTQQSGGSCGSQSQGNSNTKKQSNGGESDENNSQNKTSSKTPTKVKGKSMNQHETFEGKNDLDKQISKKFVESMVSEASNQCKDKGYLSGSLLDELESIKAPPKKDWKALLANYVAASIPAQSTKTWARLNRKFPYLLKGKKPVRVPLIGLVQDTSGSVSDAAIRAFYREIDGIRKIHKADMELVQCDAEISDTKIISYKEKLKWSVSGRGGTEFIPALKYFDKAKRKPDVVVFFTDLCVGDEDVPDEPRNYKIIWVSVDKRQCEHFASLGKYGTFIHLEVDEDDKADN